MNRRIGERFFTPSPFPLSPFHYLFMDTSQYKALFIRETEEHLKGISQDLLHLENEPHDFTRTENLFRHFHSIKGMAASMGYAIMSSLSHQLENVLDALRKKQMAVNPEIMETLFNGADTLQAFTKLIEEDRPLEIDISPLLSRVKAILTREENPAVTPIQYSPTPLKKDESVISHEPFQPATSKLALPTTMKVDSKIFDNFMGIVGELFTVISRFKEVVKFFSRKISGSNSSAS